MPNKLTDKIAEIQEQFEEKFIVQDADGFLYTEIDIGKFRPKATPDNIKSFLSSSLLDLLRTVKEEIGEVDKDWKENEDVYDIGQAVSWGTNDERARIHTFITTAITKIQE